MKLLLVVFQKNSTISPINAKLNILQVPSNLSFPFTLLCFCEYSWFRGYYNRKKIKTQELSHEIKTLSNTFTQNTPITPVTDKPSETSQIQAVDPNNKSKPQFKNYCSFCHENNHRVSTCFWKINVLEESKPQSKSPTPSFDQCFKTPFNKYDNQTPC